MREFYEESGSISAEAWAALRPLAGRTTQMACPECGAEYWVSTDQFNKHNSVWCCGLHASRHVVLVVRGETL